MNKPVHSIGVDRGGTKIRLEAVDAAGVSLHTREFPSPSLAELPAFLKARLAEWPLPQRLAIGSRGVWKAEDRIALANALKPLARQITVMSDVEAAWLGAFGATGAGILVIAGTGSIAFGRGTDGIAGRAGGRGPLAGDEGSGFWIARTWLQQTRGTDVLAQAQAAPHELRAIVQRTAAVVPDIIAKAQAGDSQARDVIDQARAHLIALTLTLADQLHFAGPVPVSWGGSVLGNAWFREGFVDFLEALKGSGRGEFRIQAPQRPAALALARLFLNERT